MNSLCDLFLRLFRAAGIVLSVGLFFFGCLVIRVVLVPAIHLGFRDPKSRRHCVREVIRQSFRLFLCLLRFLGLVRVRSTFSSAKIAPGSVLIANHPSMLDAIVVGSLVPQLVCVAKRSLVRIPIFGAIAKAAGYIGNEDVEGVLRSGHFQLEEGAHVLFFPEGTRTPESGALGPFSSTPVGLAMRSGVSITPIIIGVRPPCLFKGQSFWGVCKNRFEFDVSLCDPPWIPPQIIGSVAEERVIRSEGIRAIQHYFETNLYDRSRTA